MFARSMVQLVAVQNSTELHEDYHTLNIDFYYPMRLNGALLVTVTRVKCL